MVLKIAKDEKGGLSATLYNLDQNDPPMAGSLVSFERGTLRFVNDFPRLTYEGKMSANCNLIKTVTLQGTSALVLKRATPKTGAGRLLVRHRGLCRWLRMRSPVWRWRLSGGPSRN